MFLLFLFSNICDFLLCLNLPQHDNQQQEMNNICRICDAHCANELFCHWLFPASVVVSLAASSLFVHEL